MKKGRYYSLGDYNGLRIGFGSVDVHDLRSVYIKMGSWVTNTNDLENKIIEKGITVINRKIKKNILELNDDNFLPKSIVDLDLSLKSIKLKNKTYFDCEITMFVKNKFILKDKKKYFESLIKNIIDDSIIDNLQLNYSITKHT